MKWILRCQKTGRILIRFPTRRNARNWYRMGTVKQRNQWKVDQIA